MIDQPPSSADGSSPPQVGANVCDADVDTASETDRVSDDKTTTSDRGHGHEGWLFNGEAFTDGLRLGAILPDWTRAVAVKARCDADGEPDFTYMKGTLPRVVRQIPRWAWPVINGIREVLLSPGIVASLLITVVVDVLLSVLVPHAATLPGALGPTGLVVLSLAPTPIVPIVLLSLLRSLVRFVSSSSGTASPLADLAHGGTAGQVNSWHAAEHKVIGCLETDAPLTVESAARASSVASMCGSVVAITTMQTVALTQTGTWWLVRALALPAVRPGLTVAALAGLMIAGAVSGVLLGYWGEHTQGRTTTVPGWLEVLFWPALTVQYRYRLAEPSRGQLEVAVKAAQNLLDFAARMQAEGDEA